MHFKFILLNILVLLFSCGKPQKSVDKKPFMGALKTINSNIAIINTDYKNFSKIRFFNKGSLLATHTLTMGDFGAKKIDDKVYVYSRKKRGKIYTFSTSGNFLESISYNDEYLQGIAKIQGELYGWFRGKCHLRSLESGLMTMGFASLDPDCKNENIYDKIFDIISVGSNNYVLANSSLLSVTQEMGFLPALSLSEANPFAGAEMLQLGEEEKLLVGESGLYWSEGSTVNSQIEIFNLQGGAIESSEQTIK